MEPQAKRSRIICSVCNEEFSDRHFRRHALECKKLDFDITLNQNNDFQENDICNNTFDDPNCISDDEEQIDYNKFFSSHINCAELQNLDEEDIRCFFDNDSDDSFIDSVNNFSDYELSEEESEINTNDSIVNNLDGDTLITNETYWFCRMLMLWQCVYYISDSAVGFLLKILFAFFKLFSVTSEQLKRVCITFPKNMYMMSKMLSKDTENFTKFVICVKCFTLYDYGECSHILEGLVVTKQCSHEDFPNPRMLHRRTVCNQALLIGVERGPSIKLIPYKIFCYKSLKASLQKFVLRPDFEEVCERWRFREQRDNILQDVYDGRIWDDFNGNKFNSFCEEGNYGLMLNVDWWQPYKYTNYSIGAIYLIFLNLPREERFKRENMILVGVIPDMKSEPPTNTFLLPLVKELKTAWSTGFLLYSFKSPANLKCFKLARLCVGCDVPASRKLCGFLGHSATMGCNKCKKEFPGMVGEKNYGGFDRSLWPERKNHTHREECKLILESTSKGDKLKLEKQFGTRYSCLLELPYFDPVCMTPIDPMHNLFLGTAKHMFKIWKTKGLLDDEKCKMIENKILLFSCPSDVGKLPKKISSSMGSFNADQLKNWTILFSVYALKGILPDEHLECWRKFVLACRRLCSRYLSVGNAKVADRLLLDFCRMFESLYGDQFVTPNMHLHGHLLDCILDYGPVYSFWLFSFERQNGILGSYKTNKKMSKCR